MAADFDRWLETQFAASGPFTALIILVKIEDTTLWPLGSSYATVIGSELRWTGMRRLLDSRGEWTAPFQDVSEAEVHGLLDKALTAALAELSGATPASGGGKP